MASNETRSIDSRWDERFQGWFGGVLKLDIDKLLRADAPEYNFTEIRSSLTNTIKAIIELEQNYDFWESLPKWHRDNIVTKIDQILKILDQMSSFQPEQDSAWSQRTRLVTQFEGEYREFYECLIEKLQAYLGQRAYSQELSEGFGSKAKLELEEIRATKRKIDQVKRAVEEAATIASDTATIATALFFDTEANGHESAARNWLRAIIGTAIVVTSIVLLFSVSTVIHWSDPEKVVANATLTTIKIVMIGVLLFALKFMTKNYSAHKHLAVTNKHRANVLKSVEAHRTTAVDTATKDAVLASGVATAFGHVETGYITTKEGAGAGGDDTVAILKTIIPSKQ